MWASWFRSCRKRMIVSWELETAGGKYGLHVGSWGVWFSVLWGHEKTKCLLIDTHSRGCRSTAHGRIISHHARWCNLGNSGCNLGNWSPENCNISHGSTLGSLIALLFWEDSVASNSIVCQVYIHLYSNPCFLHTSTRPRVPALLQLPVHMPPITASKRAFIPYTLYQHQLISPQVARRTLAACRMKQGIQYQGGHARV